VGDGKGEGGRGEGGWKPRRIGCRKFAGNRKRGRWRHVFLRWQK